MPFGSKFEGGLGENVGTLHSPASRQGMYFPDRPSSPQRSSMYPSQQLLGYSIRPEVSPAPSFLGASAGTCIEDRSLVSKCIRCHTLTPSPRASEANWCRLEPKVNVTDHKVVSQNLCCRFSRGGIQVNSVSLHDVQSCDVAHFQQSTETSFCGGTNRDVKVGPLGTRCLTGGALSQYYGGGAYCATLSRKPTSATQREGHECSIWLRLTHLAALDTPVQPCMHGKIMVSGSWSSPTRIGTAIVPRCK